MAREAVIVESVRSGLTKAHRGSFNATRPDEMASHAIKAALSRIQAGTYGLCLRCGAPVEQARLDLLPYTPFCKDHAR